MEYDTKQLTAGFLVFTVLVLMLAFSNKSSDIKAAGSYLLKASFNRVDGLAVGGEIRLSGIPVGVVEDQKLDDDYRAVLTLRIDSGVVLPNDTSVAIHTDGLFGTKFLVLDPGGDEEYMEAGDEIYFTQDAVIVGELLEMIIAEGRAQRRKEGGEQGQGSN